MQKHTLTVPKTARYFQLGELNAQTEDVWIVCHGYAQTAPEFLASFKALESPGRVIIAPEGLHRFYARGTSERVAASWMTKEDRLDDIADYIRWLDLLMENLQRSRKSRVRIRVLGFSQGAATVSRWLAAGNSKADELILFCGFFPPDMDFGSSMALLQGMRIILVTASDDQYISVQQETEHLDLLRNQGLQFEHLRFDGRHVMDEATLLYISQH